MLLNWNYHRKFNVVYEKKNLEDRRVSHRSSSIYVEREEGASFDQNLDEIQKIIDLVMICVSRRVDSYSRVIKIFCRNMLSY